MYDAWQVYVTKKKEEDLFCVQSEVTNFSSPSVTFFPGREESTLYSPHVFMSTNLSRVRRENLKHNRTQSQSHSVLLCFEFSRLTLETFVDIKTWGE